ncbi:MAG TPA: hypothetical protein VK528_06550 [Flavobacterium sp.]|nr:hypothetical protein [Flavobacterium sp.]
MSTNSQKNAVDQEVDLAEVSQKIRGFFQRQNDALFNGIQFIVNHKYIIAALLIIGVGLGIYMDKNNKTYDHQIVVTPNFGSTDYLYAKIDLIESKIKENDTVFLKAIGIEDPSKLKRIEIKPIIDVYQFVENNSERNFDLLKLMAENSDIKKIVEEKETSKNYRYHVISFRTSNRTSTKKTIEPLMNYLNNSDFFIKIQKEFVSNVYIKMKANDVIIRQIDGFLNGFTNDAAGPKGEKLVYYNENSPLKDVIETKDRLVKEQGNLRINLVSIDKIIKDVSQVINIENSESVNGKLKLILPFIFIFIYISLYMFVSFYKTQSLRRQQ